MCSVYVHNIIRLFKSLHDESRPHPENWIERKGAGVLANQSRLGSNLAVLGHMDLSLGRSCSGSKLKLRHLGAKLGRSLSQVGASWAEVGALLAKVDPKLGQCCGHVGSKRCIWTILCRSAKCANYHSPLHFFAPCSVENEAPPAEVEAVPV